MERPAPSPAPHRAIGREAVPVSRGSAVLAVLLGLGCLGVLVMWWPRTPAAIEPSPGGVGIAFAELAGLLAALLICFQLLLVSRIPWLDRALGMRDVIVWHRVVGTSVLLLITTHVALIIIGGMLADRRTLWDELASTVLGDPEVLKAAAGTVVFVIAGLTSAEVARKRLPYEWWYALHVSIYVAVFLTFGHQIRSGSHFVGNPWYQLLWTELYLATACAVLVWRVLLPVWSMLRHRVRVQCVVPETDYVASVWMVGSRLEDLNVRAGQFFLVRFLTWSQAWSAHPYSVSMVPDRGRMRITVGALGNHSAAVRHLKPGTRVLLEGPFGRFTADRAGGDRVLLVAGGAGIGPIRALAHEMSAQGRDVVVIHRALSAEHLPLGEELAALASTRFLPVLGRRAELGYDPLDAASLGRLVPDVRHREAFICGSPGMSESTVGTLLSLGLPAHRIHREELSLA